MRLALERRAQRLRPRQSQLALILDRRHLPRRVVTPQNDVGIFLRPVPQLTDLIDGHIGDRWSAATIVGRLFSQIADATDHLLIERREKNVAVVFA